MGYEQVIEYWSEDVWRSYFNTTIYDLYVSASRLVSLYEKLTSEYRTYRSAEQIERNELKRLLIGGLAESGFVENALAVFCKEIFGISLEEIETITTRLKEGIPLESALSGIKITIEPSSDFISTLRSIYKNLKAVYVRLEDIPGIKTPPYEVGVAEEDYDEFLKKPEHFVGAFLQKSLEFLPLYNKYTFFINSIWSIPAFYLYEAYKRLEESKEVLRSFGIMPEILLEPDYLDEKLRKERAILGLPEGSVGDIIHSILMDIYALFQHETIQRFFDVKDELKEWVTIMKEKLKEAIVNLDYFQEKGITSASIGYDSSSLELKPFRKIEGFRGSSKNYGFGIVEKGNVVFGSTKFSYSDFIAYLAPQCFLGLAYIRPVKLGSAEFRWMYLQVV